MNTIPRTFEGKPLKASWNYLNQDGELLGIVGRYQNGSDKKEIIPYFKRNGSGFAAGIELNPRPLFGLDKLAAHPKNKAVFICEGEKPAAALHSLGVCAVTSLGGSQSALKSSWQPLNSFKTVFILPDNDEPGQHYARDVYAALMRLEESPEVKLLRLSDLPEGGDLVDWLQEFSPDWDGLQPFPDTEKAWALTDFKAELKKAEPVPEEWAMTDKADNTGFIWETPGEIESNTPPVDAFRLEIMPEPFRPWLADVSHRMQTPPDFAAISLVTVIGSLIGAGCSIKPKRFDSWEVVPNLWGACIGRPSVVLKSPSMKEPMQFLERLQADYSKQFEQGIAAMEFEHIKYKAVEEDIKARTSKAAKGTKKDGVISDEEMAKLEADYLSLKEKTPPEPVRRQFKTNETSIQSMTVLQNQNPRGLLFFRDELTGLLARWEREEHSDERTYFMTGFNGYGSYTDNKIGRGLTDCPNVCISLLGGIQPDKLKIYLYQAMKGLNDGLVQRLQLAVWPDEPETWELVDTKPDNAAKNRVYDIFKVLAEIDFTRYGANQGDDDDRPFFRFDDAGQAVFNSWLTELQTVKIRGDEHPVMIEHLGKYGSLMPSLAVIFHLVEVADGKAPGPVTERAALLAAEWCKYLESHARRIYSMAQNPEHEAALRLAEKIREKALPSPFTAKDVYKNHWHGLKDRQEVEAACNVLIEENWLQMERKPVKKVGGRPPLPSYHINPFFL
ncbi:DUF3987 domain-containing protein [Methylicorpusculum oleiharenae]|uniref:DUF3987 domain-containing protein n=1 Tax=Methylicorpusculum oleiharenae TaxID=1338687 RepID=UPI001E357AF4|nr:YfjI family protein [Methylicorpusculum oleiharenae]MCD2449304.1 DUF3987 domain-containing protein [Methylicorpusculum oleiharenae]